MSSFEEAVLQQTLTQIDNIFETVNIYKSLLVVPSQPQLHRYMDELTKREYPLSSMESVSKFNQNSTRALILTVDQTDDFLKMCSDRVADLSGVTTIICVQCNPEAVLQTENLRTVRHFFL